MWQIDDVLGGVNGRNNRIRQFKAVSGRLSRWRGNASLAAGRRFGSARGRHKKGNEKAGDSNLLVLAGLVLCNDVRDLKRELEAVRQEITEAGRSREALSVRVNEIEDVLSEALNAAAEKIEAILPQEPARPPKRRQSHWPDWGDIFHF